LGERAAAAAAAKNEAGPLVTSAPARPSIGAASGAARAQGRARADN